MREHGSRFKRLKTPELKQSAKENVLAIKELERSRQPDAYNPVTDQYVFTRCIPSNAWISVEEYREYTPTVTSEGGDSTGPTDTAVRH